MFIITEDHVKLFPGTMLPWSPQMKLAEATKAAHAFKTKFRLYDDDDELYLSGLMKLDSDVMEAEFEPLDWAMDNFGCTRIDIFNHAKGIWETV